MSEVIKKAATNEVVEFLYGDLRERSAPVIFNSATGNPVVFNDGANGLPVKSLKVNFSPIQNGSGDPSPENIRSIVPWNGLTLWHGGKNLLNVSAENSIPFQSVSYANYTLSDGVIVTTGNTLVGFKAKVNPNTTYRFSYDASESVTMEIFAYTEEPTVIKNNDHQIINITSSTWQFTTFDDTEWISCGIYTTKSGITVKDFILTVGQKQEVYEPYKSITDTDISFPSSVYGGVYEVVSGKLMNGWNKKTVSEIRPSKTADYIFSCYFSDRKYGSGIFNIISDTYKTITAVSSTGSTIETLYATYGDGIYVNAGSGTFYICDSRYTDVEEFKNAMADTVIVYEFATPVEIQLTPTQLQSLFGTNTIWSDANDDIEVEYRADTGLFLKQNTVSDVQVVESSITNNGIAHIPYASSANFGVIKTKLAGGTNVDSVDHTLIINRANDSWIKAGANLYAPIVPSTQHISAFYGLAKVAGADMAQSSNAVGTYTDPAKTAIQKMFGFDGILGDYELSTTASKAYAIGETFIFNGNRYRATTAIAINDVLAPGTNCILDPLDGKYVRDTDIATDDKAGIVIIGTGLNCDALTGLLTVAKATDANIKSGTNIYSPIVPSNQHRSAFYGLAKAAGADMKNSSNAVGTYTTEAKTAIQTMLGIEADIPLVETVTGSTVSITGMPNVRYICDTAISELTITPPASGSIVVRFTAGSNCIVSLPQTVKFPAWFDISSLEDGTTYEIIITDGVYGGVMSWA